MNITEDYLPKEMFLKLRDYVFNSEFKEFDSGEKLFSYIETPDDVKEFISNEHGEPILTFIRRAYEGFDEDPRIHCDGIIAGVKPHKAMVLYLNEEGEVNENGTAFYRHQEHGWVFNSDEAEFNRLLLEDSNDLSKWDLVSYIHSKPNRAIVYDCNMFHSKHPYKITGGVRYVLVAFLK
jgi:hypothetical protein